MSALRETSCWTRLQRVARHRWLDAGDSRKALGDDGVERLQALIAASERTHSGEIRICVEAGLPPSYLWRGASARERAVAMFGKLRVWDTEYNNGVLIYLLLADRRIEIVADRGLNSRISSNHWQALTDAMAASFKAERFADGLVLAVEDVSQALRQHFAVDPLGSNNPNELPDAVVLC